MTKATAWIFCLAGLWLPAAFGFSSDDSSIDRRPDRWTVRTNSAVVFTVAFTNGGAAPLHGFYYADQVPSGMAVRTLNVSVNGQSFTNYYFEFGQVGDVYPGCIPYRWIIEQPPGFIESNAVPAQGCVQIVYSVASSVPGTFALQQFSWAGYDPTATNATFGYSEDAAQLSLTFLADPPAARLTLGSASSAPMLQLSSFPGCSYVIEAATNLSGWTPLVTNISPFDFIDPDAASFNRRFYRALWLP